MAIKIASILVETVQNQSDAIDAKTKNFVSVVSHAIIIQRQLMQTLKYQMTLKSINKSNTNDAKEKDETCCLFQL